MLKPINYFIALLVLSAFHVQAQTDDNILWASVKVQKNLTKKTSLALAPIFRFNEDISNYQNMSIDYSVKRKIANNWSVQLLGRTWFIPDAKNRQFLWFDLAYNKQLEKLKLGSSLRYHYALDINDRADPDFIRWKTTLTLTSLGALKPFFSIEPWFRLNDFSEFQRMRYEPGLRYQLKDQLALILIYRREESVNLDPKVGVNMWVLTAFYLLS